MAKTDKKQKNQIPFGRPEEMTTKARSSSSSDFEVLSQQQLQIIKWLKDIRFKNQLIGGVDEEDVWKKILELNEKYEAALLAERIRYDVLLEQQSKNISPNYTAKTGDK